MRLVVASPTGLCFGVRRAIDQLEKALADHGVAYSIGSPIHNPQEVARLEQKGLRLVENAKDVPEGAVAFVRAHGITPAEMEELDRRCSCVIDGTCPHVRVAQKRAESLSQEGYPVVIAGDRNHPEVRGILGFIDGEATVVSSPEELAGMPHVAKVGILSQTTQQEAVFASIVSGFSLLAQETRVYNTICKATIERQESIRQLAPQVDGIVVIGGRNSANTSKLVQIAESLGVSTLWIEHIGELDRGWLEGKESIGVAAGGSTPDWLINELKKKLQTL